MSTVDVAALREAAEGATPGPWIADIRTDGRAWIDMPGIDNHALSLHGFGADAAYIAAANPTTILALIERLEAAEGAVERCRALADEWESLLGGYIDPSEHSTGYARATRRHAERLRAAPDGDQ